MEDFYGGKTILDRANSCIAGNDVRALIFSGKPRRAIAISYDDPALVAEQGYEALMAGKNSVLGGSLSHRIKNSINDLIPEQTKAKMYAEAAKPGSAAGVKDKKAS